jgi:uncharacterized protein YybS (DUF2232 family)
MKSKEITDNAIMVAIAVVMGIIPALNLFQIIPLIMLSLKYKERSIWGLSIASLLLGLFNGGVVMILASFVTVGIFSYLYGILLREGFEFQLFMGLGAIVTLVVVIFSYLLSQWFFGINPLHSLANTFLSSLKEAENLYSHSQAASEIAGQYEIVKTIIVKALPGLLFASVFYYVLIIYYVLRFFLRKLRMEIFTKVQFSNIRFPIILPIFMGILFIINRFYPSNFMNSYLINVSYFIYGVAFLEGLSVLKYYLNRFKLSSWILVFAFFIPSIFMFVGFIDIFIDLRRSKKSEGYTT